MNASLGSNRIEYMQTNGAAENHRRDVGGEHVGAAGNMWARLRNCQQYTTN